jgi:hypothetical protein
MFNVDESVVNLLFKIIGDLFSDAIPPTLTSDQPISQQTEERVFILRTLARYLNNITNSDCLTVMSVFPGPLTKAFIVKVLQMRHFLLFQFVY